MMTLAIVYWHTGILWRAQAVLNGHTYIALQDDKPIAIQTCAVLAFGTHLTSLPSMSTKIDVQDYGNGTATAQITTPFDQVLS